MGILSRVSAPCKINLHLRVFARRDDGFHDIESVFQGISLGDVLDVRTAGDSGIPRGECRVVSPRMELPPVNTLTRAVDEFRVETGVSDGIRVDIEKLVPSGAGLGGGSSDAAALLRALDILYGTCISPSRLAEMAARIGSDVPFFLSGGACLVRGRGERIESIPARTDLYGVLAMPDVHCPTAEAYALFDRWRAATGEDSREWPEYEELKGVYAGPVSFWAAFYNSFADPIEDRYPRIREIRERLARTGADFVSMTGSGSAVYALYVDPARGKEVLSVLSAMGVRCAEFLLLAS